MQLRFFLRRHRSRLADPPRRAARLAPPLLALALLAGCERDGVGPPPGPEIPDNLRRLVVTDHAAGEVKVVGLEEGTVLATLPAASESPLELHTGGSERFAYVVVPGAGTVFIVDGGIWDESGAGELRLYLQAPRLLDFRITGPLPAHAMANGHWFGTFLDGSGQATLLDERTLLTGSPITATVATGYRHHGLVAPLESAVITTTPPPIGSEPWRPGVGLDLYDLTGARLRRFPNCANPHGAAVGDVAFFGCAGGMLLVRRSGSEWSEIRMAYPVQHAGMEITSAAGHPQLPFFFAYIKNLANPAQAAILRVDAATGEVTTISIAGRGTSQEYAIDSSGKRLLVIGLDGDLHIFTASTLALETTIPGAASPQPNPLPASGIRWPTVVAGEHFAYVADPFTGRVAEVDLRTRQVTRRIEVGGSPKHIALLGTDRAGHGSVTR